MCRQVLIFGRLDWSRRSIKSKNTLWELAPVLTSRETSLKGSGKVFRACIQSVLGYAGETWAMKVEDMANCREWNE